MTAMQAEWGSGPVTLLAIIIVVIMAVACLGNALVIIGITVNKQHYVR